MEYTILFNLSQVIFNGTCLPKFTEASEPSQYILLISSPSLVL